MTRGPGDPSVPVTPLVSAAPAASRVVLLLRAVNVGGRNRLPMTELAGVVRGCGASAVRTYLQSGNAVAEWPGDPDDLARCVQDGLAEARGLDLVVLARTAAELRTVLSGTPYGEPDDPTLVHVAFLSEAPTAEALSRLDPDRYAPDEVRAGLGRELYLRYVTGAGRTKLTTADLERRTGVAATARNWRTVRALLELAEPAAG